MAGPIYRYLVEDHARLDAALLRGDYAEFREGLLRHIGMEQKILLPIIGPTALAGRIHLDHGALAALLSPRRLLIFSLQSVPFWKITILWRRGLAACTKNASGCLAPMWSRSSHVFGMLHRFLWQN